MKTSEPVNILVVDDMPEKIMAIEATLGELGQNIVKAYSGREALRCLLKDDFAVILLDVNMPEMDGFETAALIRERKRSEHTPIIFVTAFNDDVQMAKGYSLGAVDFISTPIDPEVLRTKVGVFVDLYQKTETIRHQAAHRVQLAREQAARQVAEKAMRRYALLAEASRLLVALARFRRHAHELAPHDGSGARRWLPARALRCRIVTFGLPTCRRTNAALNGKVSSSHSRIEQVDPRLAEAVRDAVESGHAQPIDPEVVQNAPDLGPKKKWCERGRRAARLPAIRRSARLFAVRPGGSSSRPIWR